jgi:hypothetical protein
MRRSIPIEEAQQRLRDLIAEVAAQRDEPIAVCADEQDVLLLVDPHHYKLLRRLWDRHMQAIRDTQEHNADVDPREFERIVTEAVEEVRQAQYEQRQASATRLD